MAVTVVRASQIANVPLNANLVALQKADPTEASFSNSAVENTLWTYSLPGGVLGINDAIVLEDWVSVLNNSGAPRFYTIRLKYGGTTILTLVSAQGVAASATTFALFFKAYIKNAGATNSQKALGWYYANGISETLGQGTAAIDSTVNQTLVLTCQADVATATQTYIQQLAQLNYLKNT